LYYGATIRIIIEDRTGGKVMRLAEQILKGKYCGRTFKCPECHKNHFIPIKKILIGRNITGTVGQVARELSIGDACMVVSDTNTYDIAGRSVEAALKRDGFPAKSLVLRPRQSDRLSPDLAVAEQLPKRIPRSVDFLVAAGGGTVNDLVKYAASTMNKPCIAFGTAPSMNGYPSTISALMVKGVKRGLAVNAPVAVLLDLEILNKAPIEMVRAGLGDVISKSVCNADWKLESIIKGKEFCALPLKIIQDAEDYYLQYPDRIADREPRAIEMLTKALVLSGISLVIIGSSLPVSGAEHLFSHFLDMMVPRNKRSRRFHGTQVGVGTIVTASLYEEVLRISPGYINPGKLVANYPEFSQMEQYIHRHFGKLSSKITEELRQKYLRKEEKITELSSIHDKWNDIRSQLKKIIRPPSMLRSVLSRAKAPTTFRELGISKRQFIDAVRNAYLIRNRHTVLDLASDFGILGGFAEKIADEMDSSHPC
jgi:glycerol-1-phosphate dehydrogenase [NAD(P)+]